MTMTFIDICILNLQIENEMMVCTVLIALCMDLLHYCAFYLPKSSVFFHLSLCIFIKDTKGEKQSDGH